MSDSLASPRNTSVDLSLRWLLIIFLGGLLLVIGLRVFFSGLQDELNQHSANERARLFIGEEIVRTLQAIEKDIYKMAVTTNTAGTRLVQRTINRELDKLRHDLNLLKHGGTVRRVIQLNIEGRDEMVREMHFTPTEKDSNYVMELIEIDPLLDQLHAKKDTLADFLAQRWETIERRDLARFFAIEEEIATFLKHLPPYFQRLDENANRLFFDSNQRLQALEAQLALQRQRLAQIEVGLVALVVILASLAGVLVMRRIKLANTIREQALNEARLARDQAERASRAKSEFVSRMSHELRTPLNAIIGFGQLLESEPLPPSQKNYVSLINSSGRHLMELINAVLDHAKIEAGQLTLEQIPFDLHETIEAVRNIVADRANDKGLNFVVTIADLLPRHIVGDPTRLRQVLINLLNNAVKFTHAGKVELVAGVEQDMLSFRVDDSGIGMDQATLSRLFQAFTQADETITRRYGGTGLGLLISKELIEAMGGTIEVHSAVGVGTSFRIRLPLKLAQAGEGAASSHEASLPAQQSLAKLAGGSLLLVDDNQINRKLAAAMLGRLGLTYDVAENGLDALHKIRQNAYALVLMDMEMPELDGISTTREVRRIEAQGSARRLPIIAMTANALEEDRQRCFEAGMDGFISKPIVLPALEAEIRRVLLANQHAAELAPETAQAATKQTTAFDPKQAIAALGDENLFLELAELFITTAPTELVNLDQALSTQDWISLARVAHTLKGLFSTFAAGGEIEALELEQAAKAADAESCARLAPRVRSHVVELVQVFTKLKP